MGIEWERRHKHPCVDCGMSVWKSAKRCRSCATKRRWEIAPIRQFPKGNQHPMWKGGRNRTSGGYIIIHQPKHPRASKQGYIAEHILVWEETHGKPSPKDWIIHHLNGIKDDNRPQNLVGFPNKKHYLVLQAKAKRIQELEAMLNGQSQLL